MVHGRFSYTTRSTPEKLPKVLELPTNRIVTCETCESWAPHSHRLIRPAVFPCWTLEQSSCRAFVVYGLDIFTTGVLPFHDWVSSWSAWLIQARQKNRRKFTTMFVNHTRLVLDYWLYRAMEPHLKQGGLIDTPWYECWFEHSALHMGSIHGNEWESVVVTYTLNISFSCKFTYDLNICLKLL